MKLSVILQNAYSKEQATQIVKWIGSNQQRFDELLHWFLSDDNKIVQRAAWPLSYCIAQHPQLINKHYDTLIAQLQASDKPSAVRRNILRAFDQIPQIPEKYHGIIMDACFRYIEDPEETIASQAFALGILAKLSKLYPEIRQELCTIIESRLPYATPAFKSRAKKILSGKW